MELKKLWPWQVDVLSAFDKVGMLPRRQLVGISQNKSIDRYVRIAVKLDQLKESDIRKVESLIESFEKIPED